MDRSRRTGHVVEILVVGAITSACGGAAHTCFDMGDPYSTGVAVNVAPVVRSHHPDQRLDVRICVADACRSFRVTRTPRRTVFVAGARVVFSEASVPVEVTVTTLAGRVAFSGRTTVTPRKRQINGAGCAPTRYAGAAVARGTHRLVDVRVPSVGN